MRADQGLEAAGLDLSDVGFAGAFAGVFAGAFAGVSAGAFAGAFFGPFLGPFVGAFTGAFTGSFADAFATGVFVRTVGLLVGGASVDLGDAGDDAVGFAAFDFVGDLAVRGLGKSGAVLGGFDACGSPRGSFPGM